MNSTIPGLNRGDVHLWVAAIGPDVPVRRSPLDNPGDGWTMVQLPVAAHRALTTPEEWARAVRFRDSGTGERFLASRAALRYVLGLYLGEEPRTLAFSRGTWGKPFIAGSPLGFNLSHSGSLALIAVAHARHVGVDVEQHRALPDLDAIAARICSPRERRDLASVAPGDRIGAFLDLWTRKEAMAKLTGEGLRAIAPDACCGDRRRYRLEALQDLPGYAACVAAEGSDWQLVRAVAPSGVATVPFPEPCLHA